LRSFLVMKEKYISHAKNHPSLEHRSVEATVSGIVLVSGGYVGNFA
jgi:hypothetical protein